MPLNTIRLDEICFAVINLERRIDRRTYMSTQFAGHADPVFVSAVDGQSLSDDVRKKRGFIVPANRFMTPSEVACTLSHKRALETFLSTSYPLGLILEDDAVIDFDLLTRVPIPRSIGFDFLKLEAIEYENRSAKRTIIRSGGLELICRPELSMGAAAYLVTRSGATRMIAAISRQMAPADCYLAYHFQYGLRGFEVRPCPVEVLHELSSDIGVDRPSYVEPGFNLRFAAYRINKTIRNRLHWWRLSRDLRRLAKASEFR